MKLLQHLEYVKVQLLLSVLQQVCVNIQQYTLLKLDIVSLCSLTYDHLSHATEAYC
jgi:hypothetical protein